MGVVDEKSRLKGLKSVKGENNLTKKMWSGELRQDSCLAQHGAAGIKKDEK